MFIYSNDYIMCNVPLSLFDARKREKETPKTKKMSPKLALPGSTGCCGSRMKQE
jgi:hypothetical protein